MSYLSTAWLFLLPIFSFSQAESPKPGNQTAIQNTGETIDVKGRVFTADGKPLPMVNIHYYGSGAGATTDQDGNFLFRDVPIRDELSFQYIGKKSVSRKPFRDYPMKVVLYNDTLQITDGAMVCTGKPVKRTSPERRVVRHAPLFILDGTRISQSKFDQLQYPAIDSVKIIKGEEAIRLYGEKGKYGVVRMVSNPKADQRISACQNSQVFGDSEQMPEFPGGELALRKYITTELQYPAEAIKEWVQGKVFVTFRISVMGKVENPRIARSVHPLLDAEALRLVGQMPDWTPGFYGRKPFRASYTIPVKFSLEDPQPPKRIIRTPPVKADSGTVKELMEVYSVIESPEFPGGEAGLKRFLEKELTYPEQAKKDSIQGCVWVSFVVNSKGVAENVKIEQGVYPLLDAEVLRVFNQIPATWKPGIQNGRKVAGVVFLSPVQFVLN